MQTEIVLLKEQISRLKTEFSKRLGHLEERVSKLEERSSEKTDTTFSGEVPKSGCSQAVFAASEPKTSVPASSSVNTPVTIKQVAEEVTSNQPISQSEKSWIVNLLTAFASFFIPLFLPVWGIFNKAKSVYVHYQAQGKAPVFLLASGGIIALVMGFTYLFQYSFHHFLGPTAKVFLVLACALGIIGLGKYLIVHKNQMQDYGSSLIALGIVLLYLDAYFAGPYYGLLPMIVGFGVLAIVSMVAYYLALLFETRIVAVIMLVGGVVGPWMMGHIGELCVVYVAFICVLTTAVLSLSRAIRWPLLGYAAWIMAMAAVEAAILGRPDIFADVLILVALLHVLFYLFNVQIVKALNKSDGLSASIISLGSANIIFFVAVLFQLLTVKHQIWQFSFIAALNVVPCALLFLLTKKSEIKKAPAQALRMLCLLYAGILVAVAAAFLLSPEWLTLVWGLEGLLLLALGARFEFKSVRVEAYSILMIAFCQASYLGGRWVLGAALPLSNFETIEITTGWIHWISASILLAAATGLLARFNHVLSGMERKGRYYLDEMLAVFLVVSFVLIIGVFSVSIAWLLMVIPLFALLYRARSKGLLFTEYCGLACFFLLFIPIFIGASETGTLEYLEQNWIARFARVEALLCLWGVAEFYTRYFSNGHFSQAARYCRLLFLLILPVCFIPSVIKRYAEFLPLAMWFSAGCSLTLFCRFQSSRLLHSVLLLETKALFMVSAVLSVLACLVSSIGGSVAVLEQYSRFSVVLGLLFFGGIFWYWAGWRRQETLAIKSLFVYGLYYVGVCIVMGLVYADYSIKLSILAALLYFSALFHYTPTLYALRSTLWLCYVLLWILASWLALIPAVTRGNLFFSLIGLSILGVCVYRRMPLSRYLWRKVSQTWHLWGFHVVVLFAYLLWSQQWFDHKFGPAVSVCLVVQATFILFQSLSSRYTRLNRLALCLFALAALKILGFDLQDFSLVEKIIALMLIGVLLLVGAYQFQKIRPSYKVKVEG